jgi:hypothetical protein
MRNEVQMGDMTNEFKVIVKKSEDIPLGRSRCRMDDSISPDHRHSVES